MSDGAAVNETGSAFLKAGAERTPICATNSEAAVLAATAADEFHKDRLRLSGLI
ncbi:hypothetical protein [Methyloferula stellata]|uniref:hypothetical protein n=1 Tax=Methyloferula stellata TaxID=876270 RepID=UPI00035FFD8F|nr:hypothetical protein [Methyloferula stellata]